jgi:hypothetical protein
VLAPDGFGVTADKPYDLVQPARLGRFPGQPPQARARREALPAAPFATRARGAVRVEHHVAHLSGEAVGALHEAAADNGAAPYPRAHGDHQHVVDPPGGPEDVLSPTCRRGVVDDDRGSSLRPAPGQLVADVDAVHVMEVGAEMRHPFTVHHAR